MLDSKTSCLLRGSAGVLFGALALTVPDQVTFGFYALFWVFIGLAIAFFLVLAITARGDESMLWFGLSAALLVIGVLSFMIAGFVAVIFILAVAAIAIYNGFHDILLALEHPRTKYLVIPGMIITGIIVLAGLFSLFPVLFQTERIFLSVVGTFALVFGLFSILLGFYPSAMSCEA